MPEEAGALLETLHRDLRLTGSVARGLANGLRAGADAEAWPWRQLKGLGEGS